MNYARIYIQEIVKLKGEPFHWRSLAKNYFAWKRFLKPKETPVGNSIPWITFDAIHFLEKHLDSTMKVFEYGTGGSTLFFCKRTSEVVSVEHEKEWFSLLSQKIKETNIQNWKGFLIESEQTSEKIFSVSDPDQYRSADPRFTERHFKSYCSFIDKYPDNFFDLAVVDGRARPSCIKHASPKIKQGGFLLLDNSNRKYYLESLSDDFQNKFRIVSNTAGPAPFLKEFSKTTVWKKIK